MLKIIQSPVLRQFAAVIIANLTIINFGLLLVWPSPMLIKLRAANQTTLSQPITENEEPWIAAITSPAGVISLLISGSLMNWLGRKTVLLAMFVPRMLTWLLLTFATEVWMILVARAIGGGCEMITLSVVATYASEVAGTKIRGASGTVTQIMSAIGMMIMFAVGPYMSYQFINVMVTCIVVVTFTPMLFIPESPYYLNSKGRTENAEEILTYLRGTRELALEEIKEYSIKFGEPEFDKWSLIKDKVILKTTGIVFFLSIGSQMMGYNTVNLYLQTIFESTQTSVSPEISSLISGLIQLIACFFTFMLTDRFGRKPILCISLIGMCGGYGMGALLWMQVAELYDGRMRPYGVSMSMIVVLFFVFLLTLVFPSMINNIGAGSTYLIFAVSCAVVCLFTFVVIPETKGRSYAEIQKDLGRRDLIVDDNQVDK